MVGSHEFALSDDSANRRGDLEALAEDLTELQIKVTKYICCVLKYPLETFLQTSVHAEPLWNGDKLSTIDFIEHFVIICEALHSGEICDLIQPF
jgi:hypothetical protein